jgi:hypothetical protein
MYAQYMCMCGDHGICQGSYCGAGFCALQISHFLAGAAYVPTSPLPLVRSHRGNLPTSSERVHSIRMLGLFPRLDLSGSISRRPACHQPTWLDCALLSKPATRHAGLLHGGRANRSGDAPPRPILGCSMQSRLDYVVGTGSASARTLGLGRGKAKSRKGPHGESGICCSRLGTLPVNPNLKSACSACCSLLHDTVLPAWCAYRVRGTSCATEHEVGFWSFSAASPLIAGCASVRESKSIASEWHPCGLFEDTKQMLKLSLSDHRHQILFSTEHLCTPLHFIKLNWSYGLWIVRWRLVPFARVCPLASYSVLRSTYIASCEISSRM